MYSTSGFGSRFTSGIAATSIVDLVGDLCVVATATSLTNGLGDTPSDTIILELLQNVYENR